MGNNLVSLTYTLGQVKKQEIVSASSERFVELVSEGVLQIEMAAAGAKEGIAKSFNILNYREDDETKSIEIAYRKVSEFSIGEEKIIIDNFENFEIRGNKITKAKTKYGEMLALDLGKSVLPIFDRNDSNAISYAIKNIQDFNATILDEVFPNRDIPKDENEENKNQNKDEKQAKDNH